MFEGVNNKCPSYTTTNNNVTQTKVTSLTLLFVLHNEAGAGLTGPKPSVTNSET